MGSKSEGSEQKVRATKDQLRFAQILQENNSVDEDRGRIESLIKKVMETTHCSENDAEIALFDSDNNVEAAVNAILENVYSGSNVWVERKSRKAKRAEAEERTEESITSSRRRLHDNDMNRSKMSERGRGGSRAVHGAGKTTYTRNEFSNFRTPHLSSASDVNSRTGVSTNETYGVIWDSMAASIDDIPEDTNWKTAGTLVFSRRNEVALSNDAESAEMVAPARSDATSTAAVSFAAVAAACTNKQKENFASNHLYEATNCNLHQHPLTHSFNQSSIGDNRFYQSAALISAKRSEASTVHNLVLSRSPSTSVCRTTLIVVSTSPPAVTSNSCVDNVSTNNSSSLNWTTQLKNDLGIGAKTVQGIHQHRKSTAQDFMPELAASRNSNTVEFVSGSVSGSSVLPDYQFGFNVDVALESKKDNVFTVKDRQVSSPTKAESDMRSGSVLLNGAVVDYSSTISSSLQSKTTAAASCVGTVAASNMHPSSASITRSQQPSSGLSYADTSIMSYYPSADNRSGVSSFNKSTQSLHHQPQNQSLYTAAHLPYNSYPYVNMYSPVTGVRQDEAQYAATALVQYPFGVGQIDMSSLSTMLPPAAIPSQQPNQHPQSIQGQHQQRPEQHGNFVDLKAYAAAAVAANSTSTGSGSTLVSAQQRENSAVNSSVAPPPGFSGPPSNLPTAFTLSQHNQLSSLFQMTPTYHPSLNQVPFSFMLPNVAASGQQKLNHQIFSQQAIDEQMGDQRLSTHQQKMYSGGHQQIDKYSGVNTNAAKDRINSSTQSGVGGMYQQQGYMTQQLQHHSHSKKSYGNGPQHWGTN